MAISVNGDTRIKSYSLTSHASSYDPSDLSGGASQLNYEIEPVENPERIREQEVVLHDSERGTAHATAKSVNITQSGVSVTAVGLLSAFNVWNTIPPFTGSLAGYLQTWPLSPTFLNNITVVPGSSPPMVSPGFKGNLLDHLKDILSAFTLDIVTVTDQVFISKPYNEVETIPHLTEFSRTFDTQQAAQKVEVTYHNTTWGTQVEMYPNPLNENPDPFTVGASEFFTTEIRLQGGAQSINQPTPIDFVENRPYDGTNGVYSVVSTADGLPVTAAEWTAAGGSVTIEITDDPSLLRVNITGANIPDKAPFRVGAMSSGNIYPALRITGTGARTTPKSITLYTGVPETETGDEVGATITNPFINTVADAINAGQYAANRLSGTLAVASANTRFLGPVPDDLTSGVVRKYEQGDSVYRIVTTVVEPSTITLDAVTHTTWEDFERLNEGLTWGEFEDVYNSTWRDFIPAAARDWRG